MKYNCEMECEEIWYDCKTIYEMDCEMEYEIIATVWNKSERVARHYVNRLDDDDMKWNLAYEMVWKDDLPPLKYGIKKRLTLSKDKRSCLKKITSPPPYLLAWTNEKVSNYDLPLVSEGVNLSFVSDQ